MKPLPTKTSITVDHDAVIAQIAKGKPVSFECTKKQMQIVRQMAYRKLGPRSLHIREVPGGYSFQKIDPRPPRNLKG